MGLLHGSARGRTSVMLWWILLVLALVALVLLIIRMRRPGA